MPDAPTKWYSTTEKTCFNGMAQDVTFTFDGTTTLPDTVRYGITYGTSHHGYPSMGVQDCMSTTAGCFYDSLNVAVTDAVGVGTGTGAKKLDANGAFVTDLSTTLTPAVQFKAGS